MVAGSVEKNLGLVLHSAECPGVNDACPIALKFRAIGMAWLGMFPAARVTRLLRKRRKDGALARFHFFARLPSNCDPRPLSVRRMFRHD
jgi:hypothetical protein